MTQSEPKHESFLSRFWPVLLIGLAWLWIFWPMITGQKVVGYRDSAYLYYPLFKWIDAQWAAGEIPLWNPYCNFGMPVVADGTSSVFYPGKLIFFCRFLSYPVRYGLFLAMHVPLAAAGAYWFARTLRANRAGATLAAFSFAFGGSVLFQVTNVIYLVSAAWLPFALCCVWKMVKTGRLRWSIAAGVACALMILGGDPQMVYHVGLIAVATVVGALVRRKRRRLRAPHPGRSGGWLSLMDGATKIGVLVIVTSTLAAIQLLPTYAWSKLSERTSPSVPANIYQARGMLEEMGVETLTALVDEPIGTADHSYQFSQPPWALSELVWPNVSGKPFPRHQRWTDGLAGADRIWVPSLYAGLLTVLMAVLGFRFWGRKRKQVWLTYLFFFFTLGSFGWYGIVWLVIEVYPPIGQSTKLGPQVGGLYWLMNMLLPSYFAFRYPAKLFVVASLAMSLLAGINFREIRLNRTCWLCLGFLGATLCGLAAMNSVVASWFGGVGNDLIFGPFDLVGASEALKRSLIHSSLVGIGFFFLFLLTNRWAARNRSAQVVSIVIVVIAAVEIVFSNRWLVPEVDTAVFESSSSVRAQLGQFKIEGAEPIRIYRSPFDTLEPGSWQRESSDNRLAEVVAWQRETLYPKQHLGEKVVLLGSFSSISPATLESYLNDLRFSLWLAKQPGQRGATLRRFHGVLKSDADETKIQEFKPELALGSALPVEWVFEYEPSAEPGVPRQVNHLWNRISDPIEQSMLAASEKNCRIIEFENNRFVARVSTDRPRVLAYFAPLDPGWKVEVRDLATKEIVPGQLVELADWLPRGSRHYTNTLLLPFPNPGSFEVEFTYQPIEFWMGAWISLFAWSSLVVGSVFWITRRSNK